MLVSSCFLDQDWRPVCRLVMATTIGTLARAVLDSYNGLRHHAVISRHHQHAISVALAPRAHQGSFVTGYRERPLRAFRPEVRTRHTVGADMLSNAAASPPATSVARMPSSREVLP